MSMKFPLTEAERLAHIAHYESLDEPIPPQLTKPVAEDKTTNG